MEKRYLVISLHEQSGDSGLVSFLKYINLWIKIPIWIWHRIISEPRTVLDLETQIPFQIEWMQDLNSRWIDK